VDILWKDKRLRRLCEESREAARALGQSGAKKLQTRLADLAAVRCVRDLVAGRPHPLKGDRAGQFSLDLADGVRLVFEPASAPVPRTAEDAIDWAQVTSVRVVYIGNYHD